MIGCEKPEGALSPVFRSLIVDRRLLMVDRQSMKGESVKTSLKV